MAYYGMPGPLEMLILFTILVMLGLPVIILFLGLSSECKRGMPLASCQPVPLEVHSPP